MTAAGVVSVDIRANLAPFEQGLKAAETAGRGLQQKMAANLAAILPILERMSVSLDSVAGSTGRAASALEAMGAAAASSMGKTAAETGKAATAIDGLATGAGNAAVAIGKTGTAINTTTTATTGASRAVSKLGSDYNAAAAAADALARKAREAVAASGMPVPTSFGGISRTAMGQSQGASAVAEDAMRGAMLGTLATQADNAGRSVGLASHQLTNMTYQINDLAVQLASGQSPFMAITQQGAQISQIFGPGATLSTAWSGLAAGFTSMLTPINLAIVGLAAAAGAASLLWNAFSGVDVATEALSRHQRLIKQLQGDYDRAGLGARDFANDVVRITETQVRQDLEAARRALQRQVGDLNNPVGRQLLGRARTQGGPFAEQIIELDRLFNALQSGEMSVEQFRAALDEMGKAAATPELRAMVAELIRGTEAAAEAEITFKGLGGRLAAMGEDALNAARRLSTFNAELTKLREAAPSDIDPAADIEERYRRAVENARTMGQVELATRERDLALARLQGERAGLPRPNPILDLRSDYDPSDPTGDIASKMKSQQEAYEGVLKSGRERLQLLQIENAALGDNTEATNALRIAYEMAFAAGKDAPDAMIEGLARQLAAAEAAGDEFKKLQRTYIDGLDEVRDTTRSALGDLLEGDWKGALQGFLDMFQDRALDNITSVLMGGQGTAETGLLGSLTEALGGVEKPKAPLSRVDLTAAAVYINGSLTGAPGIGAPANTNTGALPSAAVTSINPDATFGPNVERWRTAVTNAANRNGVPPELALAVLNQESRGNPNARSPVGATGLMQLMPGTARDLGVSNSLDPMQNIAGGTDYLGQMLRRYDGDAQKALAAYNWGPGRADKWNGDMSRLPNETQGYITNIADSLGTTADGLRNFREGLEGSSTKLIDWTQTLGNSPLSGSGSMGDESLLLPQVATVDPAINQGVASVEGIFGKLSQGLGGIVDQFLPGFGSVLQLLLSGLGSAMGGAGGEGGIGGLISGFISSLFGSANGNVFSAGSAVAFANGGIVNRPTLFPMRDGRTGLMGEAGPEAIMPLSRGADGKLGVRTSVPKMPRMPSAQVNSTTFAPSITTNVTMQSGSEQDRAALTADLARRDRAIEQRMMRNFQGMQAQNQRTKGAV